MNIDKFLNFENDNELYKLTIDGFKLWPYIRKEVYDEILSQGNSVGQAHTNLSKKSILNKIKLKIKLIPNWIFKNPLWKLEARDILVLNHQRRVKVNDYYDCVYTDQYLKESKYSSYTFEQPILEQHYSPIRTEQIRYFDYINILVTLKKYIWKKILRKQLKEIDRQKIQKLVKELNCIFDVEFKEENVMSQVENLYLFHKFSKKYYSKILDRVKPKVIIEVVSYGKDRILMNSLAKERKIPIIEFQHGTMGKYHIAYNIKMPSDSYYPDYIFTFGKFWKDVTRFPIREQNIKVVGWPYYEQKVKKFREKSMGNVEVKKTVLFISQGTIGKELSRIAVDLSKLMDLKKYRLVFKLHPGEYDRWKTEYPWLVDQNIEVIDNNFNDIHYYFAQASVQVGVYSTAIFEGFGYDLETYIVKLYGYQFMEELFEKDLAKLILDANDLKNSIDQFKLITETIDITYLWDDNSLNNLSNEIESILNKGTG